jgi:hypothetical protein
MELLEIILSVILTILIFISILVLLGLFDTDYKQFLIKNFHYKLRGKMSIVISDKILESCVINKNGDVDLDLSVTLFLSELSKIYKVPVPDFKLHTDREDYLKLFKDGVILDNGEAYHYHGNSKTIHCLIPNDSDTAKIGGILHEFYHHLDYIRNGYFKWSSDDTGKCNNKGNVFADRYNKMLGIMKRRRDNVEKLLNKFKASLKTSN